MVGTETYRDGSTNYVAASPHGVFMEEFDLLQDAEAFAEGCRQADRVRRSQRLKARLGRMWWG
jgi:hypothetical protein